MFNNLYDNSQVVNSKKITKQLKTAHERECKDRQECPFKPSVNPAEHLGGVLQQSRSVCDFYDRNQYWQQNIDSKITQQRKKQAKKET